MNGFCATWCEDQNRRIDLVAESRLSTRLGCRRTHGSKWERDLGGVV